MKQIESMIDDVFKKMGLLYNKQRITVNKDDNVMYTIHLSFDNHLIDGGLIFNRKIGELTFLFFLDKQNFSSEDENQLYQKINNINSSLKFGRVYLDMDSFIYEFFMYSFQNVYFEEEFQTYVSVVIATVKDVFGGSICDTGR